jgi:uncharacterized protein YqhQ
MSDQLPTYGGQAVIEGVMMRGANAVAIAMRDPDQNIVIHQEALSGIYRTRITKIPFLRGLVVLWDSLGLGTRALTISANIQTGEEEQLEGIALAITLTISLALGIGLFILTPASVSHLFEGFLSWPPWVSNVFEGIPDIRRVFAYHGAEHKTINAFEAGAELTPETVTRYSLEHPRCGTAFLLTVVIFSVLLFSVLGPLPLAWRLIGRLLLLPVLASLAYEYIRWTANHLHWWPVRLLIKPNLALQRLTTREPSLDMLEVSITAFEKMRESENGTDTTIL